MYFIWSSEKTNNYFMLVPMVGHEPSRETIPFKEHFDWLLPETVATEVAGQMLHYAMIEKIVAALRDALSKVELVSTSCKRWQGVLL